jgi:Zn-dependent M28 family amino/carboxypeptidase
VFVGCGVQAPEFNWDDYKGVDVRGKRLVMLVNDPPVPDPKDPTTLDPKTFGGESMTYCGRWTYKYDIGVEKGAAGVLIVHETGPAGYPWSVVRGLGGERGPLPAVEAGHGVQGQARRPAQGRRRCALVPPFPGRPGKRLRHEHTQAK